MKKFLARLCALIVLLVPIGTPAQVISDDAVFAPPTSGCAEATATIARLDGTQNAAHNAAYTTLICSLVTQGVWAKLDVMYVFATNDSANALTNLVSSSFNGTVNGAPTFVANAGYTGVNASTTVFIDSGFNPATASSPKFTQNSAHISMWSLTNATSGASGGAAMGQFTTSVSTTQIFPKFAGGNAFYNINDGVSTSGGIAVADSRGHFIANRSGASAQQGYHNAVDQGVVAVSSGAVRNFNMYVLARNNNGTAAATGDDHQNAAVTIGGSLSSTDASNLCHGLNVYLTAIAGISAGTC